MKIVPPCPEGLAFRRAAFFGFSTLDRGAGTDPDLVALGGATLGWADLPFPFLGALEAGASALAFPAGFRFATMRSPHASDLNCRSSEGQQLIMADRATL